MDIYGGALQDECHYTAQQVCAAWGLRVPD